MTVTLHNIVARCDVCKVIREIKNEDGLGYGTVMYHLQLDGWYIPTLGKTLCPTCKRSIEFITKKPIEAEINKPHDLRDISEI
jgi:hypothetical protein